MKFLENLTTELKREYVEDIKKTIVAFANTDGGVLYIGVEDDGSVKGLTDIDETMLKLSNSIRDNIKPDVSLFINYEIVNINEKNILKVTVQKGTASPYYISGKGIRPEGVFVRHGASTVSATETAIIKMIKDTDGDRYEAIRSLNQNLTFIEAEKEFLKRKVLFGENQFKTLKLMTSDGIYTNLGLMLSDQCIHSIKIAVFDGINKSVFKDRREFTGSLLKQMNDAYEFIDMYNANRSEISGLYREDKRDYPIDAIREALLNTLVHRDYSYRGSTLISIFDDHIEFVSIGGLVKGISFEDIMLGISLARNENLANIFYRLSLIEAYGTGIPKILLSYQKEKVKPKIETTDNAFKITLPNLNYNLDIVAEFSDIGKSVLGLFDNMSEISRKDVEVNLNIGTTMAGRALRELLNGKAIKLIGSGKNTRYVKV